MYCNYCGVELDKEMEVCPLCSQKVTNEADKSARDLVEDVNKYSDETVPKAVVLTKRQKWRLYWELSVVILISGMVVTAFMDLLTSKEITWSRYTLAIGLALIVNLSILFYWHRLLLVTLIASMLLQSLLFYLLDTAAFGMGWGTDLGIPLLFMIYLVGYLLSVVLKASKEEGLNIIGYFLIALGILTLGIEFILDRHFTGQVGLEWSLFVILSVMPIAGLLLFVHYRLKRGRELRRLFHI